MNKPTIYPVIVPTSSQLKSYNFYLIQDKEHLFLVDAGVDSAESWEQFNLVLKANNYSLEDLDFIVLTHHHNDHTGIINRIIAEVSIPIYAQPQAFLRLTRDAAFLKKRTALFRDMYEEMGSGELGEKRVGEMEQAIKQNKSQAVQGELIPISTGDTIGSFNVLDVPGHAIDHIALYHPDSGYLLAGDHLIAHVASNAIIDITNEGQFYPSLKMYEQSLKKCKELYLTSVYSGHGEEITEPKQLIKRRLNSIMRKSERIKRLIGDKHLTPAQIAFEYYGKRYEPLFGLVMSEIIGHLNRLELLNEVGYTYIENERHYFVI